MPGNEFQIDPAAGQADAASWESIGGELRALASNAPSLKLDQEHLTFVAEPTGLAAAYAAVVEQYTRLVGEGGAEASRVSEALAGAVRDYQATDAAGSDALGRAGSGLGGGN